MALPPTYDSVPLQPTQLFISPSPNAVQFQKGFLGVQGERAAIEGELQIKGDDGGRWKSATVSLETIESTAEQSIELYSSVLVLFSTPPSSSSSPPSSAIPATLPFSIPLMPDTPQCIHTLQSSIVHRLVATLHPHGRDVESISKSILVHTRRYTSSSRLHASPRTVMLEDPVQIKAEVPRTTFRVGEPIAVYLTIPPPPPTVVTDRGLMLRNVVAELVRVIDLGGNHTPSDVPETSEMTSLSASYDSFPPSSDDKADFALSQRDPPSINPSTSATHTVLTRSGSSCRFHTSRAVQIRLLLYPRPGSFLGMSGEARTSEQIENDDSDCAFITQSTLLHTVTFYLAIKTTLLHPRAHSQTVSTMQIPIILLPNSAPLPEMDDSIAAEYRKKHDKPPMRTVRRQDADIAGAEAGPSAISPGGAPPPFEEREAPPPFTSDAQASTSSHLPTFLESESEHIPFPVDEQTNGVQSLDSEPFVTIPGEGVVFGFVPSDQYDGISTFVDRPRTPPPTMANADMDTDVTEFADLVQPIDAFDALSFTGSLPERDAGQMSDETSPLPPPPPPMDDPSDPPPSIDSEEFRRPPTSSSREREGSPVPSLPPVVNQNLTAPPASQGTSTAPPPYLNLRESSNESETVVTHPPPYMDVLPPGVR